MKNNRNLVAFTAIILGSLILAACAPTPTPEPTQAPLPTETKPLPTATNTAEPTATITIAPTATVTIQPTDDLSGISVLGAGPSNGFYLINFLKTGINKEYLMQTDSGVPFSCKIYPAYPNRLICNGPMLPWGEKVKFNFIDPDTGQTIYSLDYTLPDHDWGFAESMIYWCVNPDACPERGQKFSCETENRKNSKGKVCMIGTCFDACGFCTGIDTCDNQ
jgi:hypothetical protein